MPDSLDFLVAGGGLAGAFSAFWLSAHGRTALVESDPHLAAGASGAAVGLVNVLMARKARAIWRFEEAEEALEALFGEMEDPTVFRRSGVWRPAEDEQQIAYFREAARLHGARTAFLEAGGFAERFPDVHAPFGALEIKTGGWLDIPAAVTAATGSAERKWSLLVKTGAEVTGWRQDGSALLVHLKSGEVLRTARLLLAVGWGYRRLAALGDLRLHGVKGQSLAIRCERDLADRLPCLSGPGHLVPIGDILHLGSTYEHRFDHVDPTPEGQRIILKKVSAMVPGISAADVLSEGAGVRISTPGSRLPMLGPLPSSPNVWIFTGLGTKGVLMAGLLSRELPDYFRAPHLIPKELAVRTVT